MAVKTDTQVDTIVKTKVTVPSRWSVILHNDDYTPMEFVVMILREVFNKPFDQATEITLHIHNHGRGVAGTYPKDIASSKVSEADLIRKAYKHPLRISMEKESS